MAEDEDKHAIWWFLALLQLDGEDWAGARNSLVQVLDDTVSSHWPRWYLPEGLYLSAVTEFACSDRSSCSALLSVYDAVAHPLDRHRRDAAALKLWVDQASSEAFKKALAGPLTSLADNLSTTW